MKSIFRVVFYLRSNYVNKEGLSPVMIRIYLNNERATLGSSGIYVKPNQWDGKKNKLKGRTTEALKINLELDNISSKAYQIYQKLENTENLSLDAIKGAYIGKQDDISTITELFKLHAEELKPQEGVLITKTTIQKYNVCKRHFKEFIEYKYHRKDLRFTEMTTVVIHDFNLYLVTKAGQNENTATKTMKTFKTIILWGMKLGLITNDPFVNHRFHLKPVDRGFLTDEEISKLLKKEFNIPRLNLVRDIFIFSCFTGLAYIDVANLTYEHIVEMNGNKWIMTRRKKTDVETNILLLDIPKQLISKYNDIDKLSGDRIFPILSNQKMNAYLKEIGDLCGINKNLTFHMARHTFATMSLSKGVPMESVSKMLGHTNIKTTQLYARITNKKIENDMLALANKLDVFNINH